ncbi:hypothetical protein C9F10_25445, partial [Salmonella enterica subsp. enterica serovar Poona]
MIGVVCALLVSHLLSSEAKHMSWQHFKQTWLIKFWAPTPAVIAAGILSTYYFGITGTFWAVTGEFTRWGGQCLRLVGVPAAQWGCGGRSAREGT